MPPMAGVYLQWTLARARTHIVNPVFDHAPRRQPCLAAVSYGTSSAYRRGDQRLSPRTCCTHLLGASMMYTRTGRGTACSLSRSTA